jgi:DNA (cytosine-5)-methyltransferase 1
MVGGAEMKHYGDITKLSGYVLPIVDVITGGSPCQDLSVAGKRAGLAGERSGLFMEQMRIVKEMRERDVRDGRPAQYVRPRYMVWENVPGAFSSGSPKGSDFQAVLEEIVRVVCKEVPPVPIPKEGWPKAGCISGVGDSGCTFSIAWRVHDAQFWGVPQRRKRISLVADFGGLSAPEILFERKGLSGDLEPCGEAGQEAARAAGNGVEGASCYGLDHVMLSGGTTYQGRGYYNNVSGCLKTQPHGVCDTISFQERGGKPGGGKGILMVADAPNVAYQVYIPDVAHALKGKANCQFAEDKETYVAAADCRNATENADVNGTLQAKEQGQNLNSNNVCRCGSVVRRLTPLECERLQGYPDGWTSIGEWTDSKGKKHKEADSPRYKALGNSIALPFWQWLARRIVAQYERDVTMASLFDGIGGFPFVFERCGAKAVWASEIEEFPIAVTKKHFPEEDTK